MTKNQPSLFEVEELLKKNAIAGAQQQINPNTWRMMRVMVEMLDADKVVIASLLEFCDLDISWIRYLAGPIIISKGLGAGWSDMTPHWLYKAVVLDRLDLIAEEFESGKVSSLATPSEVLTVMMPVTFEVPLRSDWVDVYLWAGNETMMKHNRMKDGITFWEHVGGKPVSYSQVKHNYEIIATDIRSKVVSSAKSQGWGVKPKGSRNGSQSEDIEEEDTSVIQMDLTEILDLGEPEVSVAAPQPQANIIQTSLF